MTIQSVEFSGSMHEMGTQYGKHFADTLRHLYSIIEEFFIVKHGLSKELLLKESEELYKRFPKKYQQFIMAVAESSLLSLDDIKILNAMEIFISLIKSTLTGNCTFIGIPKSQSKASRVLVGRNYDYPAPFDECVKYLSVVILKEIGKIPTAVVTIPGQIYCATGLNAHGIFCSLNNGMESGGKKVNKDTTSILTSLLDGLQLSRTVGDFTNYLDKVNTDLSLIINTADRDDIYSYEFSSLYGMKSYRYEEQCPFISTNFFQHCDWQLPQVSDKRTGYSITRYKNLKQTTHRNKSDYRIDDVKQLLEYNIKDKDYPGATWKYTIYQVACDPGIGDLYIKRPKYDKKWQKIDLLF